MSQTEMSRALGPSRRSGTVKRRLWGGLRQQWKLLGLFEIDQQHDYYSLTCMMKEGLAAAVQNCIDNPTPDKLSEKDFRLEVTQIHEGFRMETFAGPVFSSLRRSLAMTEQEYLHSLCSSGCYLQFISNSKSKADFFLTNDKRFFLKTQNRREVKFLLSNLRVYMEHLEKYPHSLLVKFLGVHRITIPHRKKKYFIVMQSVFYPDDRIHARYDIKGCEVSRWTEPAPEHSQVIVVLKDLNFEGQYITLAQQRPWLLRQMQMDTWFLQRLNVLDYSLLLAQQPLQQDERLQSLSFANLIMRTKKSVIAGTSPAHSDSGAVPGTVLGSESETGSLWVTGAQAGSDPPDALLNAAELQDFQVQNRRLLPCTRNPLHVIDGPEHRYFLGIIDIFTVYGFRKRLEHLWKRMRHPGKTFSTVSPSTYCVRLCSWVQNHSQ